MSSPSSRPAYKIVFLFDVDNTLLDNDRVIADLTFPLIRRRTSRWSASVTWPTTICPRY